MTDSCEFIVLGAGSAGAALAGRLSAAADGRVAVLEAGGPARNAWLQVPIGIGRVMADPRYSWNLATAAEPGLGGRSIVWHHGKVVGGSSSINGMLVVRGEPARYDEWARAGCPGWSHRDLLPFFRRLEDCDFGDPAVRGRGGPIPVHRLETDDPLSQAFVEACQQLGLAYNDDYNDGHSEGVARNQLNTRAGLRHGTARAYIEPALRRPGFRLLTDTLVRRVVVENGRAVGVEYERGGQRAFLAATREVIVCCGTLHSPQVLEHSGIGDARRLRELGITPLHHLPGVGENLSDHTHVRIQFEARHAVTANDVLRSRRVAARELLRYVFGRRGLFRTPTLKVTAFTRSPRAGSYPDVRVQLGLSSGVARDPREGLDPFPGFNLGGYDLYPTSRGSVHVASADPREAPVMRAGYLGTGRDVAVNLWALRFNRQIASQPAMQAVIVRETRPGPQADSDDELVGYMRDTALTSWHPVGTCKMGDDPMAVVDAALRVHGVDGLRVADASVMPFHTASNTNIPAIMVGERAADLILGNRR